MKTKFLLSIVLLFSFWNNSFAQVGVGTSNPQGALDITSTTNGVLIPRVTLTALATYAPVVNPTTGLAPVTGTLVWNDGVSLSPAGFYFWNGTAWTALGGSSSGTKWDLLGNVVGPVGTNFIGSTDNNPVSFRTNNIEKLRLSSSSQLLGVPQPLAAAGVVGSGLAPFYSFLGNQGSGMYSPGANILGFSTSFGEKMRLDATGFLGIGTNFATTAPEAALDVRSTTKGILIPRVALTSTATMAPVTTAKDSELIYNTATAGTVPNDVTPGFYYWTTATLKWNKIGGSGDVKSGAIAATGTLTEPNIALDNGSIGASAVVGSDATGATFDASTITRTYNVTGLTGNTAVVKFSLKFDQDWMSDVDAYLTSPTGQIIELTTDNGGFSPGTVQNFNVVFSDSGATNITTFVSGGVTGTYRPEGTLTVGSLTPNITTMAGFNGNSPNGTWTLTLIDDAGGNNLIYFSSSLEIATYGPSNYRLIGETSMTYKSATNIIVNSTYSGNPLNDVGFITAMTRTTASAGVAGTTVTALPGTVLSYASGSPKQGTGNYWATTNNQSLSNGLTSGTTYYFQLWTKANIELPISSNEIFSIIPMMLPQ